MKKIILTILAVSAFGLVSAQEEAGGGFSQGDIFVSGSVGFGSSKQAENKVNGFDFSPRLAYFVSENIAIGLRLGYMSTTESDAGTDDLKTNELALGAFGRYYFTPASKFSVFAELGVGITNSKVEQGPAEFKTNGFEVGVAPGVSYFLSDNFAMEASWGLLGFSSDKADEEGAEALTSFGLNLDLTSINLGLVYKF